MLFEAKDDSVSDRCLLSMINVNLSWFEREFFLHHGRNTIHPGWDVLTNPLSNVPSGERTKHFQHVHSAPSQGEEKRPASACQQNVELVLGASLWNSCGRHHRMQNSMSPVQHTCHFTSRWNISPYVQYKYASEPLRRCFVALLLRPSHWICKYTHTLQQKTYQRCVCEMETGKVRIMVCLNGSHKGFPSARRWFGKSICRQFWELSWVKATHFRNPWRVQFLTYARKSGSRPTILSFLAKTHSLPPDKVSFNKSFIFWTKRRKLPWGGGSEVKSLFRSGE